MNEGKSGCALMVSPTRRKLILGAIAAAGGSMASRRVLGDSQAPEGQEKIKEPQSKGLKGF